MDSNERREYRRVYYLKNKEKIQEVKRAYALKNKERIAEYQRVYHLKNKDDLAEYRRVYHLKNKENIAERNSAYYLKNKKKVSKRVREYAVKNKEKIAEYNRKDRIKNKNLYNKYKRISHLKKKYGLDYSEYEELLIAQNHLCAICLNKERYKMHSLAVDHCHDTGKVRGLLCRTCNSGIGLLKDNVHILTRAIEYLSKHQSSVGASDARESRQPAYGQREASA